MRPCKRVIMKPNELSPGKKAFLRASRLVQDITRSPYLGTVRLRHLPPEQQTPRRMPQSHESRRDLSNNSLLSAQRRRKCARKQRETTSGTHARRRETRRGSVTISLHYIKSSGKVVRRTGVRVKSITGAVQHRGLCQWRGAGPAKVAGLIPAVVDASVLMWRAGVHARHVLKRSPLVLE